MNEELIRLINDFKKDRRFLSFDEAATKQAVILRILKTLYRFLDIKKMIYPLRPDKNVALYSKQQASILFELSVFAQITFGNFRYPQNAI